MSTTTNLVLILLWLAFDTALGVVLLAANTRRSAGQAMASAALFVIRMLLVALAAIQLSGCGGGDWPEDQHDVPPPGVDCATRPELCA